MGKHQLHGKTLQPGVAFLYPLKTSENRFPGVIEKQHRALMG